MRCRMFVLAAGILLAGAGRASEPVTLKPTHRAESYRAELTRIAHSTWGLDAPIPVFAAQIHQESAWDSAAVSKVGAQGMGQFMPATATWWCRLIGATPADCQPRNPTWAMRSLVGYDRWLYERTPGNSRFDRLWAMLRSYNGGLGHWQKEKSLAQGPTRHAIDAQCGRASRAPVHCVENLGYPRRILINLQPIYASWGTTVKESA